MYFIITVDTEGDNLWTWKEGMQITTNNALFIPKFQDVCEKYGFVPVYLTNYEMAKSDHWVKYVKKKAYSGRCEIGMHLHAWNTPPFYKVPRVYGGNPYITEYPNEIIEEKVKTMVKTLVDQFDCPIVSHRAGRWATNNDYFKILADNGIQIDCSITPGINLSRNAGSSIKKGNDYRFEKHQAHMLNSQILEVPMTTDVVRSFRGITIKQKAKSLILGRDLWLRTIESLEDMLFLIETVDKKYKPGYLEFMIHSSELMPGGSPYNKNEESINNLFDKLERLFQLVSKAGYEGISLSDYKEKWDEDNK